MSSRRRVVYEVESPPKAAVAPRPAPVSAESGEHTFAPSASPPERSDASDRPTTGERLTTGEVRMLDLLIDLADGEDTWFERLKPGEAILHRLHALGFVEVRVTPAGRKALEDR